MTLVFATLEFTDYAIIAWIVVTFAGGAVYATRQRSDLRRLERKMDALLKHQGVSLPPIVSEEVQRILADPARRIEAIKLHREQTGLDLAEAKIDVEAFMASKH
jgi:ribosomal protein L7/L12